MDPCSVPKMTPVTSPPTGETGFSMQDFCTRALAEALNITVAERKPEIQPDRVLDPGGRELMGVDEIGDI